MSRKATLPIAAIFMIVVVALAALGVAYGLWYEVLWIKGYVATGDVDVEFYEIQTEECVDIGIWHPGDNASANANGGWFEVTDECVSRPEKDTVSCDWDLEWIHGVETLLIQSKACTPAGTARLAST
jgi:hypothetical protein